MIGVSVPCLGVRKNVFLRGCALFSLVPNQVRDNPGDASCHHCEADSVPATQATPEALGYASPAPRSLGSGSPGLDPGPRDPEPENRGESTSREAGNRSWQSRTVWRGAVLLLSFSSLKAEPTTQWSSQRSPQVSFFEKRAEGWHWYESLSDNKSLNDTKSLSESLSDNKVEEKKVNPKEGERAASLPQTPTQAIEAQRQALEARLHAAIVEPSRENITAYLIMQKALMDQSQRFAESWKRVVMTTPSLDETLLHPVDQNARHVYYGERHKDLSKRIRKLANEYGLFFFFKEKCAYCHGLAPIIKRFSQKYGWSVLAISLDGRPLRSKLPEFPEAKRDNGISKRLQITHVPALIALHPKTGKLIPLAYGLVSESEIEDRIELLTRIPEGALK